MPCTFSPPLQREMADAGHGYIGDHMTLWQNFAPGVL